MKTFRLGFADFGMNPDWVMGMLQQRYNVIRDDINPQILVFGDENFGNRNESFDHTKVFKVFFTGENRRFWHYKCHVGITYDHIDDPLHFRIPLYIHEIHSMVHEQGFHDPFDLPEPTEKTGFATFVVTNGNCDKRNQLFHLVNGYKKVDSGGPHLNNIGYVVPRPTRDKIEFLKTRKFYLAFENGSYGGYVTEKILHAYYARTVPIYWGSTTLEMDFNPEGVINWHDYRDDKKFMDRIIEVDNNDELYYHMLNQPPFKDNKPNKYMETRDFLDWWDQSVLARVGI